MVKEMVKMNECLQSLRAPSVDGAEPSVVSPSGDELDVMQHMVQKAQQLEEIGETWGR